MRVSVLIPFGGDDPWRHTLFQWVKRRWEYTLSDLYGTDVELIVGSSPEPFNRSVARNRAASEASGDVLVFADADVIVHPASLAAVVDTGSWGLPFAVYYTMRQQWTETVIQLDPQLDFAALTDEPDAADIIHRYPGNIAAECVSGCIVVPRNLYDQAGGYDEEFVNWGGEDNSFAIVLERLAGKPTRTETNALHLWHPYGPLDGFDQPKWHRNARRLDLYRTGQLGVRP